MPNPDDLERALCGKDIWNNWALTEIEAGRKPEIDFSKQHLAFHDFAGYIFPGRTTFSGTNFLDHINFGDAIFVDQADFSQSTFSKPCVFANTTFEDYVSFQETAFGDQANFDGVQFRDCTFSHANFVGDANFSFAKFGIGEYFAANFSNARFQKRANFTSSRFEGVCEFNEAIFGGELCFLEAIFAKDCFYLGIEGSANAFFTSVRFLDGVEFSGATFKGATWFSNTHFAQVPDFRTTRFGHHPVFSGSRIPYETNKSTLSKRLLQEAASDLDVASYRRLKQLAAEAKDHERELHFLALELRAKRFHETRGFWANGVNIAYDWLSSFGLSIARPIAWLMALTFAATSIITLSFWSATISTLPKLLAATVLALTNATLLIGSDKWALRAKAFSTLGLGNEGSFSLAGEALAYAQSGFSLLLFFLIGLGLRNRFRVGGTS